MNKIFQVGGMHCDGCTKLIEDILGDEEGVSSVSADFQTGTVEVDFDEAKLGLDNLKALIEEEGYTVNG